MEKELSTEVQEKISQLQMYEQSLQNFLAQKQQFQAQLMEAESALKELEKSDEAYKIIGNIMVKTDGKSLLDDIRRKKEMLDLRVRTIDNQQKALKEKALKIQDEVMKEMEKKK